MQIDVRRVPPGQVIASGRGLSSARLREGVLKGRAFASWRTARSEGVDAGGCIGADLEGHGALRGRLDPDHTSITRKYQLDDEASKFLESMARASALSGRGIVGTARVARTIADIEESAVVSAEHVAEALGFRIRAGGVM